MAVVWGEMDVLGPELSSLKSNCIFYFFLNSFLKDMLTLLTSSTGQGGKRSELGSGRTLATGPGYLIQRAGWPVWERPRELERGWQSEHPSGLLKPVFPGL